MTAAYFPASSGGIKFVLLMLLLAAAATVALMMHADITHPGEAESVRQCISRNGVFQLWEMGDKQYRVCQITPGVFGIQVIIKDAQGAWREVTSFIRKIHSKPADLGSVMDYLTKLGAVMK